MSCNWLLCNVPKHVTQVEIIFPMVGNSCIPPDRAFGNIEEVVRKTSTMTHPDGYIIIIKEHATVLQMREDYKLIVPKELQLGVSLKLDKIKSISSLLASHYGSDWKQDESLCYFTTLFQNNNNNKHHSEAAADKEDADPIEDKV
ncbi:hypothetical protein QE152_g37520 [Popillia japonica]|uniref:Uncharacterized protein n=1 Tax=Popillia japonica TaxID=7064 RepID=A0AAW1IAB4_POPJA